MINRPSLVSVKRTLAALPGIKQIRYLKNQVVKMLEQLVSLAIYDHEQHKAALALLTAERELILETLIPNQSAMMASHATELRTMVALHKDITSLQNMIVGLQKDTLNQALIPNQLALMASHAAVLRTMVALHKDIAGLQNMIVGLQKDTLNQARLLFDLQARVDPVYIINSPETLNPELSLLRHLFPLLNNKVALDVGAHEGDFSAHLLESGYQVYSFEPYLPSFTRMDDRLKGNDQYCGFNLAIGSRTEPVTLNVVGFEETSTTSTINPTVFNSLLLRSIPNGMQVVDSISCQSKTLNDLVRNGDIPDQVAVLKIDTEGFDLEVLRAGDRVACQVIVSEYSDPKLFLSSEQSPCLSDIVEVLKNRGYVWYLVFATTDGATERLFYTDCNCTIPNSWGNAFFFASHELYTAALQWCSGRFRQARFQPVWIGEGSPNH